MAFIVLATICFLACIFYLFVLVQWTQDTKRKTTTRPEVDSKVGETRKEKLPTTVGSRRTGAKRDRSKDGEHEISIGSQRSGGRESWSDERERIAYERIARSFKPGKRS